MLERSLNLEQSVRLFLGFFYQVKIFFRTRELVIMYHHHIQSNILCLCKPQKASISVQDPWCINIGFSLLHIVIKGESLLLYLANYSLSLFFFCCLQIIHWITAWKRHRVSGQSPTLWMKHKPKNRENWHTLGKNNLDVSLLCFTIKHKCLSVVVNAVSCHKPPILAYCVSVSTLIKCMKATDTSVEHNHK